MIRTRLVRLTALLATAALLLSACAPTLPTSGPVSTAEAPVGEGYDYGPRPVSPQPGAVPDDIIRGFLQAGAGVENDYEVAREYLTEEAAEQWDPGEETLVHQQELTVQASGTDSVYNVHVPVHYRVDDSGSMTRPGDSQNRTFELVEVDGEWRIGNAPDGKILDLNAFNRVYDDFTLYFYDPQQRYAVPDARWLVSRAGLSTEIVRRMCQGPAPWLAPGVTSAFEEEDCLGTPAVPIEDGVATVDLDPAVTAGASDRDLALMHHQLSLILSQLSSVRSVAITVAGNALEPPAPDELPESERLNIETQPTADDRQIAVQDDALVWQHGNVTSQLTGMPDLAEIEPRFPAVPNGSAGAAIAVMSGDLQELYHVHADADEPELLIESEQLTRPSMDNFGWTWTVAHEDGEPTIRAFSHEDPEAAPAQFTEDFIGGREVTSLRISQDGTRAALVVDDAGARSLYIASVVRDPATGAPWRLGQHYRLHPDEEVGLEEVRWSDNDEVLVWRPYDPDADEVEAGYIQRINLVGAADETEPGAAGLLNVSVGEGLQNIYIEQVDYQFSFLVGNRWEQAHEAEEGVRDLSFPG